MIANLGGFHLLILLAIVLLIFGAAKLPALAKSVGQSTRIFKNEMRALKEEDQNPDDRTLPGATSIPAADAPQAGTDSTP